MEILCLPLKILLKKKNAKCYHSLCESVAKCESLTAHIDDNENPADTLTKIL